MEGRITPKTFCDDLNYLYRRKISASGEDNVNSDEIKQGYAKFYRKYMFAFAKTIKNDSEKMSSYAANFPVGVENEFEKYSMSYRQQSNINVKQKAS